MGLALISAAEIFSQRTDLCFCVGSRNKKFGFSISRGPGHDYKTIASTDFVFKSRKKAIDELRKTLKIVIEAIEAEFNKKGSFLAAVLNPEGKPFEEAKNALTQADIERICRELLRSREVHTSSWKKEKKNK